MQITIEGKEYNVIPFKHTILLNDDDLIILRPIQTPEFKVGDRVEAINSLNSFTDGMVYKIAHEDTEYFYLITDVGYHIGILKREFSKQFKPYEKPKEGERVWFVGMDLYSMNWKYTPNQEEAWNLGLAFHKKEQAEFARERLSKLF